jgi:drug/metabolite transporter (DMT)-like permease
MLTACSLDRVRTEASAADLMLLVTMCLWALNFSATKYVLGHGVTPLAFATPRYATAAAIFAVLTVVLEGSLRAGRADLAVLGVCAVLLFVNQVGFTYSLKFSTATTVALVFGTFPIFAGIFAALRGIETITRRFVITAAISFSGVVLVAVGSGGAVSASLKGDAFALLAVATWAAYSIAVTPLMPRLSPYRISVYALGGAAILLALGGSHQLANESYPGSWRVWATFAFAVLGPLVLTNVLWFTAIERVGPSRAALFSNLQFFLAALFGIVLLSESITTVQIVGGVAIAAAIAFARVGRVPAMEAVE